MGTRTKTATLLALLLPLLLANPGLPAQKGKRQEPADRIVLKDGKVLTGRIQKLHALEVEFQIKGKDSTRIPRTRIRAIQAKGKDQGIYGIKPPEIPEQAPPKTYIQFKRGSARKKKPGSLGTGVTRWYHAKTRTTLFLVAAVHIGEQPYYTRLQQIMDSTDVVLYEKVNKGDAEISDEELASLDAMGKLQLAMKDALGLEHQMQGIDYERSFWKNADVDYPTLRAEMKKQKIGLPTDNPIVRWLLKLVASMVSGVGKDEKTARKMRGQLAPILAQADKILAGKSMKKFSGAIIIFRNEAAMGFLHKELENGPKGRWLSLFYGAGHMPDFDKRLKKDGWEYQGVDWVPAWNF